MYKLINIINYIVISIIFLLVVLLIRFIMMYLEFRKTVMSLWHFKVTFYDYIICGIKIKIFDHKKRNKKTFFDRIFYKTMKNMYKKYKNVQKQ